MFSATILSCLFFAITEHKGFISVLFLIKGVGIRCQQQQMANRNYFQSS